MYLPPSNVCRNVWWASSQIVQGYADKSLSRPPSRSRRTESIMSLESGVCSCAELQVFSCYRDWKEACHAMRAISTTTRRELSTLFFLKSKAPKEIRTILKETLGEYAPSLPLSKIGWPNLNVVICPPVLYLILDDSKQWQPQRLVIKFMS